MVPLSGWGRWRDASRGGGIAVISLVLVATLSGHPAGVSPTEVEAEQPHLNPLAANFTANVASVACNSAGDPVDTLVLRGLASGGVPPYTFEWALPSGPAAGPNVTTIVSWGENSRTTLTVPDSGGMEATHSELLPLEVTSCAIGTDVATSGFGLLILGSAIAIMIIAVVGVIWWRRGRARR
jgi:hypothetical protein